MELRTATLIVLILTCIYVLFNLLNFAATAPYYLKLVQIKVL